MFDALYIPGGENSIATLLGNDKALHFVNETYKHCKAIAANWPRCRVAQSFRHRHDR